MKAKKKHVYISAAVVILAVAALIYFNPLAKQKKDAAEKPGGDNKIMWMVDKNCYLYYPLERENIKFRRDNYSETSSLLISKVIFESKGANIYGLLASPKSAAEQLPGIILLPGAGVSKESKLELAKNISALGAVVLVIDQRGVGETDGGFPSLDDDYARLLDSKEPYQHLMVYDALKAYDLLYSAPFVNPERIIIAGESLGGRVGVIAAAIDRRINGVLLISSAGFDFKGSGDASKDLFLKSIDSDNYISMITPRKIVMMHYAYDMAIPLSSAIRSYLKAQEPKRFVLVNDTACNHGYCSSMYDGLVESLNFLVDIKSRTILSVPDKKP